MPRPPRAAVDPAMSLRRHPPNLRDSKGKPAHKTCAQAAIAQQTAEATE
ncbi:hypothetical protein ACWY4P_48735 [Streptomyces sp. LZ34]